MDIDFFNASHIPEKHLRNTLKYLLNEKKGYLKISFNHRAKIVLNRYCQQLRKDTFIDMKMIFKVSFAKGLNYIFVALTFLWFNLLEVSVEEAKIGKQLLRSFVTFHQTSLLFQRQNFILLSEKSLLFNLYQ